MKNLKLKAVAMVMLMMFSPVVAFGFCGILMAALVFFNGMLCFVLGALCIELCIGDDDERMLREL